jgi:hypothetical protein
VSRVELDLGLNNWKWLSGCGSDTSWSVSVLAILSISSRNARVISGPRFVPLSGDCATLENGNANYLLFPSLGWWNLHCLFFCCLLEFSKAVKECYLIRDWIAELSWEIFFLWYFIQRWWCLYVYIFFFLLAWFLNTFLFGAAAWVDTVEIFYTLFIQIFSASDLEFSLKYQVVSNLFSSYSSNLCANMDPCYQNLSMIYFK